MFGAILAIIVAALVYFTQPVNETLPQVTVTIMGITIITVATLFLFLPVLINALAWSPLQKAEQNLTPRISTLFRKDRSLRIASAFLLFFSLISYLIAFDILFFNFLNKNIASPVWIVLLGVALDALHLSLSKISKCLDPFYVVDMYGHEAQLCIQNGEELDLCYWIDALSEIAIRAMQRNSMSLCNHSVDALQRTARIFMECSKSIAHAEPDGQAKAMGIGDAVSYMLFFLLQRLEMINDKGIEQRLEPVCSSIITAIGKIVIASAKCDISLPTYPLQFLGRFAVNAQRKGLLEVGPKATCTLIEVAKSILTDIDITYAELQPPYFSLIAQLEAIAKEMFARDKTINIKLLMQPFEDLKTLFSTEKMAAHQDTPAILNDINRVLAEFSALDDVMRAMPPMPAIPQEANIVA